MGIEWLVFYAADFVHYEPALSLLIVLSMIAGASLLAFAIRRMMRE